MAAALTIWGMLSATVGLLILVISRTGIDAVEGALGLLIATVVLGSAGIIDAVKESKKRETRAHLTTRKGWLRQCSSSAFCFGLLGY